MTARHPALQRDNHAADCSVLVELAHATAVHNWTYKGGWLNATMSCCAWELVGCDEEGRVKVLALSFNGLAGVLPIPRLVEALGLGGVSEGGSG